MKPRKHPVLRLTWPCGAVIGRLTKNMQNLNSKSLPWWQFSKKESTSQTKNNHKNYYFFKLHVYEGTRMIKQHC